MFMVADWQWFMRSSRLLYKVYWMHTERTLYGSGALWALSGPDHPCIITIIIESTENASRWLDISLLAVGYKRL